MNALSRYAHPVYDAIQSARRYGRVPEGQANPFAALASFGGMDDPLSMIGGPAAAAAAPLSRVGRMAPMMERVPGAAAAAPPPGAAGMVRGQPSTAALPGETEAQRVARLEQRAREWAAEQLRMLDAPPQPQAAYPVGRSGGMMLEGAVPGPLPRRRATPGGRYALGEG